MVDMGQADRDLYRQVHAAPKLGWVAALNLAADEMGYEHWADVPRDMIRELHLIAKNLQSNHNTVRKAD